MANYPGTKLVGVAYNLRKKLKNSPSCVHVLHNTFKPIVLRRCRCCRRPRCLSSLMNVWLRNRAHRDVNSRSNLFPREGERRDPGNKFVQDPVITLVPLSPSIGYSWTIFQRNRKKLKTTLMFKVIKRSSLEYLPN